MTEHISLIIAGTAVIAILCQWIAWRLKLPAILFLLLAGIVAGPLTGWLDPDAVYGNLLFPMVSLSVAVILFEGGLTLKLREIRGLESVVRNLVSVGVLVTWTVTTLVTHWILNFEWQLSWLFGAVMVVTGPTVIVPLLRTVRPNRRISNILRWEGIVIDPIGALLAVLVFEFIVSNQAGVAISNIVLIFAEVVGVGCGLGAASGFLFGWVLRRHALPEYLHNVAALCSVVGVFAGSNYIVEESGLLTVTVMGIWLANMDDVPMEDILNFKESLSVLLISVLFIILAARIEIVQFQALGWSALWIFIAIQFLARPLKVMVSTFKSDLNWRERTLLGWIAPRGIVAAAVTALFAIRLREYGFEQAELLVPLAFLVIIGTVVLQSATAGLLARLLGVAEPEPKGFLIIGANPIARAIAVVLKERGFSTLLTDSNWEHIKAARMLGLETYYGNPVSDHADWHLNLVGIGRMLGLSRHADLNALSGLKYRAEFGRNAIYTLKSSIDIDKSEKHTVSDEHRGNVLFGDDVTYGKLASLLSQGAQLRSTLLTEDFDFTAYCERNDSKSIPMFSLSKDGELRVFVAGKDWAPKPGWTIIGLFPVELESVMG